MRPRSVPLRRSLIVRLLAASILVAVCSIVATAWLAVKTTTGAIRQEQGSSLAVDASVYDKLIEYGATHSSWDGVGPTVEVLGRRTGSRITLMTEARLAVADSGPGPSLATASPSATVDPLRLDTALAKASGIDPRAVGPYKLRDAEKAELRKRADRALTCLRDDYGLAAEVVDQPSGRPTIKLFDPGIKIGRAYTCGATELDTHTTGTERKLLDQLGILVGRCLGLADDPGKQRGPFVQDIVITPGYVLFGLGAKASGYDDGKAAECLTEARRTQMKSFVAPPALLFVTKPDTGRESAPFTLSRGNTIRIAGVTGLVLLVTILITVVVGLRLVRPLRDLTEAAQQPADLRNKMPRSSHDEIGYLAQVLNDQSDRRIQLEQQRKAMVNDVAHELRTPLTNIRTSLEAAQDGVTPVDSQLIELLHEEALLLQHVIDDLRDLAAADAGQLRVHRERVYANDLLAQVVEAHRGAAEAAGVHLSATTVADPEVVVDPARLRQLVGNLISNAVRHTPRGGRVTVTSRLDADHHVLLIDVADTGVGIAPDDLPKVFDRFWRADASRARSTGGSGLGLAIARKLAEAHAGGIGVTSSLGSGTVFTVSIPASTGPGHS